MCGRYGYVGSEDALREDFADLAIVDPLVTGYNLSPGRRLSVVMNRGGGAELRAWLDPLQGDAGELRSAVKGFSVSGLEVFPVATAINDARLDGPALVAPAPNVNLRDRERTNNH